MWWPIKEAQACLLGGETACPEDSLRRTCVPYLEAGAGAEVLGVVVVLLAAGAAAAGAVVVAAGAGATFAGAAVVLLGAGVTAACGAMARHSITLFLLSHSTFAPTFQPSPPFT